jgi:hypothetical protein
VTCSFCFPYWPNTCYSRRPQSRGRGDGLCAAGAWKCKAWPACALATISIEADDTLAETAAFSWLDDIIADGASRAIAGGTIKSAFLAAKAAGVAGPALLPYFLAKKLCEA